VQKRSFTHPNRQSLSLFLPFSGDSTDAALPLPDSASNLKSATPTPHLSAGSLGQVAERDKSLHQKYRPTPTFPAKPAVLVFDPAPDSGRLDSLVRVIVDI